MASKIKVDQIEGAAGSTITIPSGQTLTVTDGLAASTIASGTLADARIPNLNASKITAGTLPATRGGTGLSSLGSAGQIIQVNSGGSALEFAAASSGHLVSFHHDFDNTNYTTTSSSFGVHGHGISIAITPASTSSKFLLLWVGRQGNNMSARRTSLRFTRDGSDLSGSTQTFEMIGAYATENNSSNAFYDSPNTTSSITYSVEWNANGSSDTANIANQRFSIFEFAS